MLAPSVWRPDGLAAPAAARLWRGPAGALQVAPTRGRATVGPATDRSGAPAAGDVPWPATCHVAGSATAVAPARGWPRATAPPTTCSAACRVSVPRRWRRDPAATCRCPSPAVSGACARWATRRRGCPADPLCGVVGAAGRPARSALWPPAHPWSNRPTTVAVPCWPAAPRRRCYAFWLWTRSIHFSSSRISSAAWPFGANSAAVRPSVKACWWSIRWCRITGHAITSYSWMAA